MLLDSTGKQVLHRMASATGNITETTSILLLSKTGNGKSSLANALLNTTEFQVGCGMKSSTAHCKCIAKSTRDRNLTVVDTPGIMDVADEEKAKTELREVVNLCSEGFDIFLLVVRSDTRFTAEEGRAVELVAEMFGDEFYRHAIVVFSHGDDYDNDETKFKKDLVEIRKTVPCLDQLLNKCENRFTLVDNGPKCDKAVQDRQMEALLSLADDLVTKNQSRKYTSEQLEAQKKRAEEAEARNRMEEKKNMKRVRIHTIAEQLQRNGQSKALQDFQNAVNTWSSVSRSLKSSSATRAQKNPNTSSSTPLSDQLVGTAPELQRSLQPTLTELFDENYALNSLESWLTVTGGQRAPGISYLYQLWKKADQT